MGKKFIDLKLSRAKDCPTPPMGVRMAEKTLAAGRSTLSTITARSQEFLVQEDMGVNGDCLCANWNLFGRLYKEDPKMASAMLVGALQEFMLGPKKVADVMLAHGVQEYTTKADFPAEVLDVIEKYHTGVEEIDVGWRQVFDVKDFTATKKNGFKLRDVSSTLTYRKVPAGDKVEVYKMTGSDAEVTFDRYGGALGWDRTWFDDEEYWLVTDTAIEFRSKFYNDMATVHYGLIEALGAGINLAWQNPSPVTLANTDAQYELSRDINTINAACLAIFTNLKAAGMNVTPNTPLVILAPLALRARLNRALQAAYGQASLRNPTQVEYVVTPIYTLNLTSNTVYYVTLPGKKTKSGIRKELEVFSDFDILAYADVSAGWGRYGAGIGEASQFVRCATA